MSIELRYTADLALFTRVVQCGSISDCAVSVGLERTTVSRRIAWLERYLGVKLLDRSAKRIAVTEAGERCFEMGVKMTRAAEDARSMAMNRKLATEHRPVVIGASIAAFESFLKSILEGFSARHPDKQHELHLTETWQQGIPAEVDIGISLQRLRPGGVLQQKAGSVAQLLCASPAYLDSAPAAESPDDLLQHSWISEHAQGGRFSLKLFQDANYRKLTLTARHVVSHALEVRQAALAGLGICCLPEFMCREFLEQGRLQPVLPGYEPLPADLYLVSPKSALERHNVASVRTYLESAMRAEQL